MLLRSLSSGRLLRALAPGDAGPAWVVQAAGEEAGADDLGVLWRLDTAPASFFSAAVTAVAGAAASCTVHLLARGTGGYVNLPAAAAPDVRTHRPGGIAAYVENHRPEVSAHSPSGTPLQIELRAVCSLGQPRPASASWQMCSGWSYRP